MMLVTDRIVTNILKWSPSLSHQHKDVTNITVTVKSEINGDVSNSKHVLKFIILFPSYVSNLTVTELKVFF